MVENTLGTGDFLFTKIEGDPDNLTFIRGNEQRLVNEDDLQDFWEMLNDTDAALPTELILGEPVETGGHDEDRDGPVPFDG